MSKNFSLLLIIYILFSSKLYSQSLHLKIEGVNNNETRIIDSLNYKRQHINYLYLKAEIDTLQSKLSKNGYLENKRLNLFKSNDSIFLLSIALKKKYKIIKIFYKKTYTPYKILDVLTHNEEKQYFTILIANIKTVLQSINQKQIQSGDPFSKVKLSEIRIKQNGFLEADLLINTNNKKRTLNSIIIKGYEKFPKSFLKQYLKIKQSQKFDLDEIKRKTNQLNNLNFASQIKSPEVLFSKDSTDLYIYIKKRQSNSFDGFLGFGTNEETKKLQFDGYLNLNLINNLNYGETFRLRYKSDENEQKTFETKLTLPYLFRSPIGLDLQLKIFQRDSTFSTTDQSIKIHYQINPNNKIHGGIITSISNNLLSDNNTTTISDYTSKFYSFGYSFDKPQNDNLLFPINSSFSIDFNFGKRKSEFDNIKQTSLNLNLFKIFNINNTNSIFIKLNGLNLNSNSYFENELFRFGGINSIRGFEENSILASQVGIINSEYRYKLSNNIYIHSIIDVAYFQNKLTNTEEKLFGFGMGLGILTKSGLLKLNYANGKNENQKFKLSNSKIHISLKTRF